MRAFRLRQKEAMEMGRKEGTLQVPRFLCLMALAVLALALAACHPAELIGPEDVHGEPLRSQPKEHIFSLGVLGPFSGPSESTGREYWRAVTMAFEEVEWQIGSYRVEPVWIDSQGDPERAAAAYEEAIVKDGVQAAILNWHSSVALECMEVAAEYRIPHIFPYGATEAVNEKFHSDPEKYGYWMNKGWPVPEKLSIAYVEALEAAMDQGVWRPEAKTVAIFGENTHWGRSFGESIRQQLEAEGWTTVAEEYFPLNEVQFHSLLYYFKAKNVDLVAVTTTSMPSFAAFINQADEAGIESLIIADGLGWAGEWYAMTGQSSDYVLDQIPGWATAEGQAFAQAFEQRWGTPPSPSAAGLAYDGANMFIEIARRALDEYGELSSQTVYRWARENLQTGRWSFTGGIVMPEYKYTPETLPDPVLGPGYYMFPVRQYVRGEGRIIYPPDWATHELQVKP
jgi:branched-chain amino acid transport system substrate-binding protein